MNIFLQWATHGTWYAPCPSKLSHSCAYLFSGFHSVSTLEPDCFEEYSTAQEVVPYFETVVQLFQQLNTYYALTSAGVRVISLTSEVR